MLKYELACSVGDITIPIGIFVWYDNISLIHTLLPLLRAAIATITESSFIFFGSNFFNSNLNEGMLWNSFGTCQNLYLYSVK